METNRNHESGRHPWVVEAEIVKTDCKRFMCTHLAQGSCRRRLLNADEGAETAQRRRWWSSG
jgi:hypothetical protein